MQHEQGRDLPVLQELRIQHCTQGIQQLERICLEAPQGARGGSLRSQLDAPSSYGLVQPVEV